MVETRKLIIICAGVTIGFVVGTYLLKKYKALHLTMSDISHAHRALADLKNAHLSNINIPEIHDELLREHFAGNDVLLAKHPSKGEENIGFADIRAQARDIEHMAFLNGPANTRDWPYYHYTFPYQYTEGGAWPPNMYSRLYNWQPGYDTAGWSYWMRPGMSYARWPRNRWVRNNGSFYYINNGGSKDRAKDFL
jgi:hypothetical protein